MFLSLSLSRSTLEFLVALRCCTRPPPTDSATHCLSPELQTVPCSHAAGCDKVIVAPVATPYHMRNNSSLEDKVGTAGMMDELVWTDCHLQHVASSTASQSEHETGSGRVHRLTASETPNKRRVQQLLLYLILPHTPHSPFYFSETGC